MPYNKDECKIYLFSFGYINLKRQIWCALGAVLSGFDWKLILIPTVSSFKKNKHSWKGDFNRSLNGLDDPLLVQKIASTRSFLSMSLTRLHTKSPITFFPLVLKYRLNSMKEWLMVSIQQYAISLSLYIPIHKDSEDINLLFISVQQKSTFYVLYLTLQGEQKLWFIERQESITIWLMLTFISGLTTCFREK